jgi:hypothetical protein
MVTRLDEGDAEEVGAVNEGFDGNFGLPCGVQGLSSATLSRSRSQYLDPDQLCAENSSLGLCSADHGWIRPLEETGTRRSWKKCGTCGFIMHNSSFM